MKLAIIGHEGAKFTPLAERAAREIIGALLTDPADICISGRCPLGGVDVWAEEYAKAYGNSAVIFPPASTNWEYGFKPRNLQIARAADTVHVLVVATLPDGYTGRRFPLCYHCKTSDHVKSGACWTAWRAVALGKQARWYIIDGAQVITRKADAQTPLALPVERP